VESRLSTLGGVAEAVGRKMTGGSALYQQFWTSSTAGDVIVAPKAVGDVAAVKMDGTSEYHVRQGALLAVTPQLTVTSSPKGFGLGVDGLFNYRVKGKGTLAISTYGGLYRLVLAPGEEYRVDQKHIVAWDASMTPAPVNPPSSTAKAAPAAQAAALAPAEAKDSKKPELADRALAAVQRAAVGAVGVVQRGAVALVDSLWERFIGRRGYYLLRGPGDFYLSSRIRPSLNWIRSAEVPGSRS
ncbi:mitochondrial biogenesis protein AIM24, partial [Blyttiomyces helicus]